jgi:heme o synthase
MQAVLSHPITERLRMYWNMTRPKVLFLVLFTALPVFGMTGRGWAHPGEALKVLFGTALAGAASSTLNAWLERETDARMARTRNRALPAASMAPNHALGLGIVLTVVSTLVLLWIGGWLAAAVGLGTILFYVLAYTWYLKPRTPQNIVIGGAAGATAPMIAEAALTGHVTAVSLILFAIIFLWTPPHFWAIAIFRKEEYANAGFPMMPIVAGDVSTRRQSLVYTILLIVVSLLPVPLGLLGVTYGAAALLSGLWFMVAVIRSMRAMDPKVDYAVFRVSIGYLFILFGAMFLDLLL